jgi:hypothetical protein
VADSLAVDDEAFGQVDEMRRRVARSEAATIAVTDPLPFVPAI